MKSTKNTLKISDFTVPVLKFSHDINSVYALYYVIFQHWKIGLFAFKSW